MLLRVAKGLTDYLDHIISPGKLAKAQQSIDVIRNFEFPRNLTQVRSFSRVCTLYTKFVRDFANTAPQLTNINRKD